MPPTPASAAANLATAAAARPSGPPGLPGGEPAAAALAPRLIRSAGFALAALLASLLAHAVAVALGATAGSTCFWPPAGVLLVAAIRGARVDALAAGLGLVAGAWAMGEPLLTAALTAAGSVACAIGTAAWLRSQGFDARLGRPRDLGLLLGAAAFGLALGSAALGSALPVLLGQASATQLPIAALHRWQGEWLGALVLGLPAMRLWPRAERLAAVDPPMVEAASQALAGRVRRALEGPEGRRIALASLAWLLTLALWALSPYFDEGLLAASGLAGLGLLLPVLVLPWLTLEAGFGLGLIALAATTTLWWGGIAAGLGPVQGHAAPAVASQAVPAAASPGARVPSARPAAVTPDQLWQFNLLAALAVLATQAAASRWRRQTQRWQGAVEGSDLGVAEWDLATGQRFATDRWIALLGEGAEASATGASLEHFLARVHAEDRGLLRSALAPMDVPRAAAVRRDGRLRVAGGWRWFDIRLRVLERQADGQPLRVLAVVADIGAQRQAEDRHQWSSDLFRQLHEGLAVTDANFRILEVNPAFCQMFGQLREAMLGQLPATLLSAEALDAPAAGWTAALRTNGQWTGELIERGQAGILRAWHLTASRVVGPDGQLRYHVLVVSDLTEQRQHLEQIALGHHQDPLTRLPNRLRLAQLMADALATTEREGHLLAVCYIDLDRFKAVNDALGTAFGDQLLAQVADRLRLALRHRRLGWSDIAARVGGDEFVLLVRAFSLDEARAAVQRVLRVLAQPFESPAGEPLPLTASIGATVFPLDGSDADTLLRHAHHAMFDAKQGGRNGVVLFDPESSRRAQERAALLMRLELAVERDEFELHYQPKVDLRRGVVLGVEALLRWNRPETGLQSPAEFLPQIEATDLSARIGDRVLERAIAQLAAWHEQGLDLSVSVNISGRHLQDPGFADRLAQLLGRQPHSLGPKLELEVLETAALQDIGLTSAVLEHCARLGVRWALDDFGTGYSTLTYLKRLPVQVLKIDRSFVQHMLSDEQDRAIIEGVLSLAQTFDCTVVAEGVETAAQARLLLQMGCEIGQGAGIASAMPAGDVACWVRSWKGLFPLEPAGPPGAGRPGSEGPEAIRP